MRHTRTVQPRCPSSCRPQSQRGAWSRTGKTPASPASSPPGVRRSPEGPESASPRSPIPIRLGAASPFQTSVPPRPPLFQTLLHGLPDQRCSSCRNLGTCPAGAANEQDPRRKGPWDKGGRCLSLPPSRSRPWGCGGVRGPELRLRPSLSQVAKRRKALLNGSSSRRNCLPTTQTPDPRSGEGAQGSVFHFRKTQVSRRGLLSWG